MHHKITINNGIFVDTLLRKLLKMLKIVSGLNFFVRKNV